MQLREIPEGIDENNACRVVIDVSLFSTVEDGQAVYRKGRCLQWWVDSEEYSIIDMEKDVLEHFTWASNQEANFWFSDEIGQTTRLATDQELLTLLRASKIVKFIMTVDRCVGNVTQLEDESQVIDADNGLLVQVSNDGDNGLPVQVSNDGHLQQVSGTIVAAEYEDQEWADELELGVTAAGPARVEEEEKEHYMDRGFDPDGDDPIAADEEWRYFKKQEKEKKVDKRGKIYEGIDPDVVPSDEATMIRDAAYVAHTTYERDNPEIKKGSTYTDKDAFILIIKQYAIKREFETFVEYSDTTRYRARCADSACEWKIHAKKLCGCPTFMVVSISEGHTCATTSQVKDKEASKGWIADRKRKGEAGTSKQPASKKSKKGGAKKGGTKKGAAASTSNSLVPQPPGIARTSTSIVPVSPGPTTRRMAASISTLTNSPSTRVSVGPTTRRMAS